MRTNNTIKKGKKLAVETARPQTTESYAQVPEQLRIPLEQLDLSPLNYRKYFSQQALLDFAEELKVHGLITALAVRRMPTGRYEVIAGERRWRAAKMAGLTDVPVLVFELSDAGVREFQLAENIQREDPHPLREAQAITDMQFAGKSRKEIAARLGKSESFVYNRLKLVSLIEPFQEMFLAGMINTAQAVAIAALAADAQAEFFEDECEGWQDTEAGHDFNDLEDALNRYKADLHHAPFDTEDATLVPAQGACGTCPFNSATVQTLFPELADEAICSNRTCYSTKSAVQKSREFATAIAETKPDALLIYGQMNGTTAAMINSLPGDMPVFNYYDVFGVRVVEMPERDDFELDVNDEGELVVD